MGNFVFGFDVEVGSGKVLGCNRVGGMQGKRNLALFL